MTVKQVAEKVYGPIPEGATLHPAFEDDDGRFISLCFKHDYYVSCIYDSPPFWRMCPRTDANGPDISDRPATSFVGFFGKEFDDAVRQES